MKLNVYSIDEFRNGFAGGTIRDDEIHIVYPKSMVPPEWASSVSPHDLFLQQSDLDDPANVSEVQRIKNTLISKVIRAHVRSEFHRVGLPIERSPIVENIFLDGFIGDAHGFLEFASLPRANFAGVDKTSPIGIDSITQGFSKYFTPRFFEQLIKASLPTTPTIGQLEAMLCIFTDYTKAPSTMACDLISSRGSVEVKCKNGRLGGQDVDMDGITSKREFARLIGCQEDPLRKWGAASYSYYQDRLSEVLHIDWFHAIEMIECMMNYRTFVTRGMVNAFYEDCCSDLRSFHGALHLHCYTMAHGFVETIFLSRKGDKVVSYEGRTFSEARAFFKTYLRNRGGWGSQNQDRSGVQVEYV